MKNTMINVFMFTTGAAIGSLVTWKIMKDRSERYIQEEVAAFKEDWTSMYADNDSDMKSAYEEDFEPDDEYKEADQVSMITYHNLTNMYAKREEDEDKEVPYINGPYVISPEDYGDGNYGHDLQELTYYADGILADGWDVELSIEETIGEDSLNHIGEYAEDIVHVRNERLKRDYEVVADPRRYADAISG